MEAKPFTRSLRTRAFMLLGALALGSTAQGCVENEVSFYISQSQVPMPGGIGGGCIVPADRSSAHLNSGVLDVGLATTYRLFPLYENQLLASVDPTSPRAELRNIVLMGADVELRRGSVDGPLVALPGGVPSQYTIAASSLIPASSGTAPGTASGDLDIIPPAVGQALKSRVCQAQPQVEGCNRPEVRSATEQIVVVVRAFGRTQGGIEQLGNYFAFPVNVCCGCLINFPPEADSRDIEGPDCNAGAATTDGPCQPGQDFPIDCRACSGSNPLCQPLNCRTP